MTFGTLDGGELIRITQRGDQTQLWPDRADLGADADFAIQLGRGGCAEILGHLLLVIPDDAHVNCLAEAFAKTPFDCIDLSRVNVRLFLFMAEFVAVQQRYRPSLLLVRIPGATQREHVRPESFRDQIGPAGTEVTRRRPHGVSSREVKLFEMPG